MAAYSQSQWTLVKSEQQNEGTSMARAVAFQWHKFIVFSVSSYLRISHHSNIVVGFFLPIHHSSCQGNILPLFSSGVSSGKGKSKTRICITGNE